MSKGRKVQPVSFNIDDNYERELREYAIQQQKYFSRYVKRLIEEDRRNKEYRKDNQYRDIYEVKEDRGMSVKDKEFRRGGEKESANSFL